MAVRASLARLVRSGLLAVHEFPSAIRRGHQLTGAPHRGPVIRVNRSTNKAHLVVLSIRAAMGPGEPVRTESFEESLEELGRHTYRSFLSRVRGYTAARNKRMKASQNPRRV